MAPAAAEAATATMKKEMMCAKGRVCVMDASGRLGSNLVQRLLQRGYIVHAALHTNFHAAGEVQRSTMEGELMLSSSSTTTTTCCDHNNEKKRLRIYHSDPLDYHSILDALKGCSGLFYCFEPPPDHPSYDELMAELEVRAAHNVLEACAQTDTIEKVVFTSSATAVVWSRDGPNSNTISDFDERKWSDINFCKKYKLWHALSKTLAEKTAWALAMDRDLNMVSVNGGLLMSPPPPPDHHHHHHHHHHQMTVNNPYLKGAAEMYEDGVFVTVDLRFLVDAHICVFEDVSSYGRYLCFDQVINSNVAALELAQMLFPPSPSSSSSSSHPQTQSLSLLEEMREYQQRISNKKLNKLMVDFESSGIPLPVTKQVK